MKETVGGPYTRSKAAVMVSEPSANNIEGSHSESKYSAVYKRHIRNHLLFPPCIQRGRKDETLGCCPVTDLGFFEEGGA